MLKLLELLTKIKDSQEKHSVNTLTAYNLAPYKKGLLYSWSPRTFRGRRLSIHCVYQGRMINLYHSLLPRLFFSL